MPVRQPKTARRKRTKLTWRSACRLKLHRTSPCGTYSEIIDPGANFFVAALEKLGAKPHYSCAGHPNGFYVMFEASYELAQKIYAAGYFRIEIEGKNVWSIRFGREPDSDTVHDALLDGAAKCWTARLGPFYKEDVIR